MSKDGRVLFDGSEAAVAGTQTAPNAKLGRLLEGILEQMREMAAADHPLVTGAQVTGAQVIEKTERCEVNHITSFTLLGGHRWQPASHTLSEPPSLVYAPPGRKQPLPP